ncbi:NUDIX domain-containing protein [Vreelandella sp. EE22]
MSLNNNERQWAQLVVINTDQQLLLIHHPDEASPCWSTAGGELHPEESFPEAALRTLEEAAGLKGPLGPLLHECQEVAGKLAPTAWLERYFLVRYAQAVESGSRKSEEGALHYKWWSLEEMQAASREQFKPAWLPELLERVLTSEATVSAPRL